MLLPADDCNGVELHMLTVDSADKRLSQIGINSASDLNKCKPSHPHTHFVMILEVSAAETEVSVPQNTNFITFFVASPSSSSQSSAGAFRKRFFF